jgi:kumamolisin
MGHASSVVVPQSSIGHVEDIGVRSHTNILLETVHGSLAQGLQHSQISAAGAPPFSNLAFETPASLGCVYNLVSKIVAGCNPNSVTENPTGGSRTIAIVDSYDDPNAMSDLNEFSSQFGLPLVNSNTFKTVYASGPRPVQDPTGGWEGEESLDIEITHAMAPGANIILVEAASNLNTDLYAAVQVAAGLVGPDGGEVSMGWGSPEYSGETSNDSTVFATPGVVYVASTGDTPGTEYPSVSPNVVAAGGSTVRRNPFTGNLIGQAVWQDAGSGPSYYESRPAYQKAVAGAFPLIARNHRGVPDLSFDSDPYTGAWIYDSIPISDFPSGGVDGSNWYIYGGTSLAVPAVTGIINVAGHFAASSTAELTRIYNHRIFPTDFHDIATGTCGAYNGFSAAVGWDYCTGVGTPVGYAGK